MKWKIYEKKNTNFAKHHKKVAETSFWENYLMNVGCITFTHDIQMIASEKKKKRNGTTNVLTTSFRGTLLLVLTITASWICLSALSRYDHRYIAGIECWIRFHASAKVARQVLRKIAEWALSFLSRNRHMCSTFWTPWHTYVNMVDSTRIEFEA